VRWDIRTTAGEESCVADEYAIDEAGALLFYKDPRPGDRETLVIAFGPAHWIYFAPHEEDPA
jgi:hypothetical protein